MCVTSYIGDQYRDDFPNRWPRIPIQPWVIPSTDTRPWLLPHEYEMLQDGSCDVCGFGPNHPLHKSSESEISREDFDALKREVEALRELLLAAKEYDEATGQSDCEMEEKIEFIRQVAEFVGVDVDEVFGGRFQ